jgi:hypothetical protein
MSFIGRVALVISLALMFGGCTTSPPDKLDNICDIFREKEGWYADAKGARERWGAPISIMMAFMHQESRFVAGAKPPRTKIWGIIPGPRASDAYGYSQAKHDTWDWYKRKSGNHGADRDKFEDAIDFVGWYNHTTHQINGISKDDAFRLYLNYHEGHGGYKRGTYRSKPWLIEVAKRVDRRAATYSRQLASCKDEFKKKRWLDWF